MRRHRLFAAVEPLAFAPDDGSRRAGMRPVPGIAARNATLSAAVIAAHAAVLALVVTIGQRPPADVVIPAMVVAESVEAAAPAPPPPAPEPPRPVPRPVQREPVPQPTPVPQPAVARETPAAEAIAPATPSVPATRASTASTAPVPAPAPPRIEPPSASAAYLDNPPPVYPRLSRRLGEQGTVLLRVLIGVDGAAAQAELAKSSGFDRLDHAAMQAVRRWKYRPGTRNGVPEAMWFNVPVKFELE